MCQTLSSGYLEVNKVEKIPSSLVLIEELNTQMHI